MIPADVPPRVIAATPTCRVTFQISLPLLEVVVMAKKRAAKKKAGKKKKKAAKKK